MSAARKITRLVPYVGVKEAAVACGKSHSWVREKMRPLARARGRKPDDKDALMVPLDVWQDFMAGKYGGRDTCDSESAATSGTSGTGQTANASPSPRAKPRAKRRKRWASSSSVTPPIPITRPRWGKR